MSRARSSGWTAGSTSEPRGEVEVQGLMELPGFRLDRNGRVATLMLDRPPLNVLNIASLRGLSEAVWNLGRDEHVGALVVAGAGKCFCAGVDVREHVPALAETMIHTFHNFCRALLEFPRPTLARVHGSALGGGCEVALCCDLIVAGASARVGLPEITLGVFPPVAAVLLPRRAGAAAAARAVLWGEVFPSEEALRWNLVTEVQPDDRLEGRVAELAGRAAGLSSAALREARHALRRGAEGPLPEALKEVERIYLEDLMKTHDAAEGIASFVEKRLPVWSHR